MKPSTVATLLALTASAGYDLSYPIGERSFSGNGRCRFCRKATMSSEFCDLRCVCAYNAREREKAEVKL